MRKAARARPVGQGWNVERDAVKQIGSLLIRMAVTPDAGPFSKRVLNPTTSTRSTMNNANGFRKSRLSEF